MSKVAILTDSTAYLPEELRKKHNITMIPLNVVFGVESYREEIDITAAEFYVHVRNTGELPTTSQPAIGLILEELERLSKDYDEAIMVTLSSGISGTYQSAVAASDMVENIKLHVFDSEISCMAQGFYVLKAAEMAEESADAQTIIQALEQAKVEAYFMVEDLTNLHRGGRLNAAQMVVGNLLQLKPILTFVDKKIVPFEKIRTHKKAINRLYELMSNGVKDAEKVKITVIHANREDEAKEIAAKIQNDFPHAEIIISYFGPVIGTHLGEGGLGIAWLKENDKILTSRETAL